MESENLNQWNPTLIEELIIDILSRLPVKSLLRFRSVSKSWLALISSPEFVKTHLSVSAHNKDYTHHRLLKYVEEWTQFSLQGFCINSVFDGSMTKSFDFTRSVNGSVDIAGSVNGLICISYSIKHFMLLNPSNMTFKKLPDCHYNSRVDKSHRLYSYCGGFGYDEFHDDYKVVSVVGIPTSDYSDYSDRFMVRMYSLRSDRWSSMDDLHDVKLFCNGFLVNGKLHWNSCDQINGEQIITSLDLVDGKWGNVEKPPRGEQDGLRCYLGMLGGDLSAVYNGSHHSSVWVMKEYGVKESWTKMCTIKYHSEPISNPYEFRGHSPLFISNNGELLLECGRTSMIYNPDDESIKHVEFANLPDSSEGVSEFIYMESLLCPLLLSKEQG